MKKEEVKENFGYRLLGSKSMKNMVIETLLLLPEKIAVYVSKHCWFISSFEDGYAFVLKGTELKKDEYLIFLSDELLKESKFQIVYTIVHEIGHVILGHRNGIGVAQTREETRKQEKEADNFVRKYLN